MSRPRIAAALLLLLTACAQADAEPGTRSLVTADRQADFPNDAHFHHVHLNVTDVERTRAWYETYFGANRVDYRDRVPALFTEKSFFLLNEVDETPRDNFGTNFWHIGWAGVDGHSEFDWRTEQGIEVQTPLTALGNNFFMYFWGPDRELVEVYTGSRNHRYEHVHLVPSNIDATLDWFRTNFDLEPNNPPRGRDPSGMKVATIRIDNVNLIMFEVPPAGTPDDQYDAILPSRIKPEYEGTEGRAMDHIAFSFADIDPVFERMVAAGTTIVDPIAVREPFGFRSFFVRAPDQLLVEVVEEGPVPEGIWR